MEKGRETEKENRKQETEFRSRGIPNFGSDITSAARIVFAF
jgi:hypothetical protein